MHGIILSGFTWVPLASITESSQRANEIISRLRKRIDDKVRMGLLQPGLKEQYDLQLDLLESGQGADIEFAHIPGHLIPLKKPEPGKAYMTGGPVMNHNFSRGTVVRYKIIVS